MWKLSKKSYNCPESMETFRTVWKLSGQSGHRINVVYASLGTSDQCNLGCGRNQWSGPGLEPGPKEKIHHCRTPLLGFCWVQQVWTLQFLNFHFLQSGHLDVFRWNIGGILRSKRRWSEKGLRAGVSVGLWRDLFVSFLWWLCKKDVLKNLPQSSQLLSKGQIYNL